MNNHHSLTGICNILQAAPGFENCLTSFLNFKQFFFPITSCIIAGAVPGIYFLIPSPLGLLSGSSDLQEPHGFH